MRVLIVEDDMTIALMIEDMLIDCGHEVVGIAMRLEDALEHAAALDFDLAILDVNLDGSMSFPVAEKLRERGVPFFFATGYGAAGIPGDYAEWRALKKPFTQEELQSTMIATITTKSGPA